MPLYEYVCEDCGAERELLRKMAEADEPTDCGGCGGRRMKRKQSVFAAAGGGGEAPLPVTGGGGCCPCGDPGGPCNLN